VASNCSCALAVDSGGTPTGSNFTVSRKRALGTRRAIPTRVAKQILSTVRLDEHLAALLPPDHAEPTALHRAMRHAVLSGGKRFRSHLLCVAAISSGAAPADVDVVARAACAVEMVHGASLAHDDLPAFDDAVERRGRPSVHAAFGVPIALLTGTALLCRAFEILAEASCDPVRKARLVARLASATGSQRGIIGGQALEQNAPCVVEPSFMGRYHEQKTGALFSGAAAMGAIAAGAPDPDSWGELGARIGLAYQIADDLADAVGHAPVLGKPAGNDERLGRPNLVAVAGLERARTALAGQLADLRERARRLAVDPGPVLALIERLAAHFEAQQATP
jgi:geranylgeranyl diphosphate synthase, type II